MLKNIYTGWDKIQNCFGYPLEALVSVEESVSVRGEDEHPQLFLVLGWWNLVLLSFVFLRQGSGAVPHSGFFWLITIIILHCLLSTKFWRLCLVFYGHRQEKKNSYYPRVRKMIEQFFIKIFCIYLCKILPFNLWSS